MIHRPSELRHFLRELGINPKKSLSQNFLIDGNIIQKVVESAEIGPGDFVIEIGPGPGAITEAILDRGAHLIAIEKDRTLAAALERLQTADERLEIISGDVLEFPFESALKEGVKYKVISNLPHQITTPILTRLAPLQSHLSIVVVMLQEEVARRLTAKPGNKEYGSITLFLEFYFNLSYLFSVGRSCFYPSPNIDSAVIALRPRTPPLADGTPLHQLVRLAFSQRRKMVRSTVGRVVGMERVEAALTAIGVPLTVRPEELSLDQFLKILGQIIE